MDKIITRESHPGDMIETSLLLLVRASQKVRPKFSGTIFKAEHYLESWCVIRCGTSRTCGHTTAAVNFARQFFEHPVFVFGYATNAEKISQKFKISRHFCAHYAKADGLRGLDFDCMVLDDASGANPEHVKAALAVAAGNVYNHAEEICILMMG